jgi:uncharacterized protein (TIGR02679 family)
LSGASLPTVRGADAAVLARVRAILGAPDLGPVVKSVRRRLEDGGGDARTLTLRQAPLATRVALANLLGWSFIPDEPVRVPLGALDRALRESAAGVGLREALELLGAELRDRREERRAGRAERERRWSDAAATLAAAERPELAAWLDGLRAGALARAARAARRSEAALLDDALRVALRLPAGGRLLPVFAGEVLDDPHALDPGAALTPLVLRAAAAVAGWDEVPPAAAARRRLWAEVGVDCDALSATVLVHGLRPGGDALLARQLREAADAGEPRRITLRELERSDLAFASPAIHVCENPAVVAAAADALGPRSTALVCSEGVPTTAVTRLLERAAACGARLLVHADLDWAGLRIAGQLLALPGAEPWRLCAGDYEAAVAGGRVGPALEGRPAIAPWDPALPAAMASAGRSVPEERVLEALLRDLGQG